MNKNRLISVVVITNGNNHNLFRVFSGWISDGFVLGENLFFCGPKVNLLKNGISEVGIIDYLDPPYYLNNFHINHKKRKACEAIEAEYIYLVHDRFFPKIGLLNTLTQLLHEKKGIDFGAVDVDNEDGTPALRELRLRNSSVSQDLESALESIGRLTCTAKDLSASSQVAINGGQFFIRKAMTRYLDRPLRWVEMEDDVLSHDLRSARGLWISDSCLITVAPRCVPNFKYSQGTKFKYKIYQIFCNIIASITFSLSVGRKIENKKLKNMLSGKYLLIDPLHKIYASDFLPSSLEKIMTRARIASNGASWSEIKKHTLGWKLIGLQGRSK